VAVGDDLGTLGETDDGANLFGVPALEDPVERNVDRPGDVSLARIAVGTGGAFELVRGAHVDQREPFVTEPLAQLGERHVSH
jgi:hypothetical protein